MTKKSLFNSAALGGLLLGASCFAGASETAKPNFLFLFADDHAYDAIRAISDLDIDTPNLDRLAERGANFSHTYNMGAWNGAVCIASRTMLVTGRSVWNAGRISRHLDEEVEKNHLWAQQLKQAGYQTYLTGKWHVNVSVGHFDMVRGKRIGMLYTRPNGHEATNRPIDEAHYEAGWKPWDTSRGGMWGGDGSHASEWVAKACIAFINDAAKKDKQPFFIHASFNAPHDPRQSPKEYIDRYPLSRIKLPENFLPEYPYKEEMGSGETLRDEMLAPFPRTEYAVKIHRQEYFAIVTHMDHQIGKMLDALDASGMADNTYIIFTGDHGLAVGHHGLMGKQNMYEHSARTPLLIAGPGIEPGSTIDTPVYLQDIMPTTLELAGVKIPEHVYFKSLMPLIEGTTDAHYSAIYSAYMSTQRMVAKDGWKLIYYPDAPVYRLFNLEEDPQEMNDLANNPEYASKLAEMKAVLAQQQAELDDPLDDANPDSWDAYHDEFVSKRRR